MTLYYADPQFDTNIALKSRTVAGEEVPGHDVISLPGTAQSDIAASSGYLGTLVGYLATVVGTISAGRLAVDLSTTLATYLSNLPTLATYLNTLQGAITSARMQVDLATTPTANLATLAGAITSSRMAVNVDTVTTGKIDTLHADLATTIHGDLTPGTPYIEQITGIPAVGGTASAFSSHAFTKGESAFVRNCSTGGQLMYVTVSGTTPTATNGWILAPGECTPPIDAGNANVFKLLGSTSGGAAAVLGS